MTGRGAEATEAPTPRRVADARRRGLVAVSGDLTAGVGLTAAAVTLVGGGADLCGELVAYIAGAAASAPGAFAPARAGAQALRVAARVLALPILAAFAAALVVGLAQTRGLLTFEAFASAGSRRGPNTASVGGLWRATKALVLFVVAALSVRSLVPVVLATAGASPARVASALGAAIARLGVHLALAALLIGTVDYLVARRRLGLALRMTRVELDRERRESEGDPARRAERRRVHQELVASVLAPEVAARVARAELVAVADDGYAVAVSYAWTADAAPVVVAKGSGIVAVARAAGVPVVSDVVLTTALAQSLEGESIPEAAYERVATVLRSLGRFKGSGPASSVGEARSSMGFADKRV